MTGCESSSTSAREETCAVMSMTFSAGGPRSLSPPTCPGVREQPSSTTWWPRSSPRGSRSTLRISTRDAGQSASISTRNHQPQPTFAGRETEALTKRLRHEGNGHPNGTGLHSRNGHQSRNGHVNGHEIDLPTALVRSLMPDQAMIESTQNAAHPSLPDNEVILGFLGTMTAFLSTQQQVMQAYLLGDRDTSAGESAGRCSTRPLDRHDRGNGSREEDREPPGTGRR